MARGLDQLEGEALELVLLIVLVIIGLAAFAAWKAVGDPAKTLGALLSKLWAGSDSIFLKLNNALTRPAGSSPGTGPDVVYTGTNLDPASDSIDYSSDSGGDELSMYDQQASQ